MATLKQVMANRANSLKSTGPRTEAGKIASRANALKHGLAGRGVVLPDEEQDACDERAAQWCSSFRPFYPYDMWLLETVAVEAVRTERCRVHERAIRERLARRAIDFWDEDRRLAAEFLAAGLRKKPEIVARQLRQTLQGADLLIERWEELGEALAHDGVWNESDRTMALDLLGVPLDRRSGRTKLDPPEGSEAALWLGAMVRNQLATLNEKKPALDELDEAEQVAATQGLGSMSDPELKLIRRYEAGCMLRLERAVSCIRKRKRDSMPYQPEERPRSWPTKPAEAAPLPPEESDPDRLPDREEPSARVVEEDDDPPASAPPASPISTAQTIVAASGPSAGSAMPSLLRPVSLADSVRPSELSVGNRRARLAALCQGRID